VNSTNPSSGVAITVSPADLNSNSNGNTSFTRSYKITQLVTLTAPTTSGSNNFNNWTGCDNTTTTQCTVTMSANKTVSANYTASGTITVSPTVLTFNVLPGLTQGPVTVTYTNNSGGSVTVSSVTANLATYSVTNNCGSVTNGGTCTAHVSFTPTVIGAQNGTLSFADNASGSPRTVTLNGAGASITLTVSRPVRQRFDSGVTTFVASGATPAVIGMNVSSSQTANSKLSVTCGDLPRGVECSVSPGVVTMSNGSADFQVKVGLSPEAARAKRLDTIHVASGDYSVRVTVAAGKATETIIVPFTVE